MRQPIALLASLLCTIALPSLGQEPYRESIDVNLVLVDVTVTDGRGNHILGLGKDDFIVTENGVEQNIASVDYFTNRRLLTGREEKAAFKVERVREERYFILFFDKLLAGQSVQGYMNELMQAKRGAVEFVRNELLPDDRVAVAGFDARLKIYSDFTSDPKQLEAAINEAITLSTGRLPSGDASTASSGTPSILANIDEKKMMNSGRIYEAVTLLADAVRPIAARKVMMMFSLGMGEASDFSRDIARNEDHWYEPMVHALNRANVTVYPIHLHRFADPHATEQPLHRLALETGGEYFRNIVDFATPLRRIENVNNGYYMLTYYSEKPKGAHGYQEIEVKLKNREFRVAAREGYAY